MLRDKENLIYSLIFSVVLATVFLVCVMNHYEGQSWGDDFSLYLNQARSIVEGTIEKTVADNRFAVTNSTISTFSPESYPWGFPLLLAPLYWIFGLDYTVFKIFEALMLVAFLGAFYVLLENKLKNPHRLVLVSFVGLNHLFIYYTNHVLSEIPFLFFSTLTLYAIQKAEEKKFTLALNLWVGGLMLFTFFIRTEGIALVAALFSYQLFIFLNRKPFNLYDFRLLIIYISPFLVFIILYFLTKLVFPAGFTSHLSFLEHYKFEISLQNMEMTFKLLGLYLNQHINLVSLVLVVLVFFIGIICRWREDFLFVSYWFAVLGILFIWPFFWDRYMYALIPLFCYFFVRGLERCSLFFFSKNYSLHFLSVLLILNLYPLGVRTSDSLKNKTGVNGPEIPESQQMFEFIRANVPQEEVVIFGLPRLMNFYTLRKSVFIFDNLENVRRTGNYLVIFKNWNHDFQIRNHQRIPHHNGFQTVFENDSFIIYRIHQ